MKKFKISDALIKEMYLNGSSLNDIAKIAQDNKGLMALRNRLHKLGVDTSRNMKKYSAKLSKSKKKYTLDEHVFDSIDSEEKAYWLGWYMTDGYNHENKGCVSIRLQGKDLEILEKLKIFLKTDAPIYIVRRVINGVEKTYVELNITSSYFSHSLSKYGIYQNKSHNKSIVMLPLVLLRHFIRGYFDGDGCFSVSKRSNRTNGYSYQLTFTGNLDPLVRLREIFSENLDTTKVSIKLRKNLSYTLHYSGRKVCYKILDWLYQNSTVYLKRKHDKYLEYCISAE